MEVAEEAKYRGSLSSHGMAEEAPSSEEAVKDNEMGVGRVEVRSLSWRRLGSVVDLGVGGTSLKS